MNWYQNQSEEWKNAIGMISEKSQRNELMVEKDVIQSMFLSELSKLELPFVFKGGTSLSKAYQLTIIPDVIFEPHHYFLTTNML